MLGWVVGHGQIITAEDMTNIHSLASMHDQDPAEWQACAPLAVGQRVLGVLAIDSIEQQAPEFERLLYILANFSAVALNNGQLFQRVERMARHDGLTGLLNHAAFQSRLADMLHDAGGTGQPLSVIMADLDHFKHFNDRFGHQAGDYVLSSAGKLWSGLIAPHAAAARYGGEEFVCLLPGASLDEAAVQAEALRWALEQADLQFDGVPLRVTASFGVATFPTSADAPASLIRGADSALYAAKRSGRNRVCVAQDRSRDEPMVREIASADRC
jgi:diguanylate cyclase (GGDEF)-like protein